MKNPRDTTIRHITELHYIVYFEVVVGGGLTEEGHKHLLVAHSSHQFRPEERFGLGVA